MFFASGINGALGRAFLLVGIIGSLFGAIAAITSARQRDQAVAKLIPRFAVLVFAASFGAFAVMERAMITRDFSLEYVQKWEVIRRLRCTTLQRCGARLKDPS